MTSNIAKKKLEIHTLFKQTHALPTFSRASFLPSLSSSSAASSFTLTSSIKDINTDETRLYQSQWRRDVASNRWESVGVSSLTSFLYSCLSPSRRLLLTVRAAPSKPSIPTNATSYILDITETKWPYRLLYTIKDTHNFHDKINTSTNFGGFQWNEAEDSVCYIAEPKKEERKSGNYFAEEDAKGDVAKGCEFEEQEEWGEIMVGVRRPRPFIAHFNEEGTWLLTAEGLPEQCSIGQPVWANTQENTNNKCETSTTTTTTTSSPPSYPRPSSGLFVVVFPHNPTQRRLGIAAYNTRQSYIAYLSPRYMMCKKEIDDKKKLKDEADKKKKEEEAKKSDADAEVKSNNDTSNDSADKSKQSNKLINLTPNDHSAQCPRLSPSTKQLCYITTEKVWFHVSCSMLKSIDLATVWPDVMSLIEQNEQANTNDKKVDSDDQQYVSPSSVSDATRVLVDVVREPATIQSFPGLWPHMNLLPSSERFWLDDSHLLVVSAWRSTNALLVVGLDGSVARVPLPSFAANSCSMSLYDSYNGRCIVGVSNLNRPECLLQAHISVLKDEASAASDSVVFRSFQGPSSTYSVQFELLVDAPQLPDASAQSRLESSTVEIIQVPINDKYASGADQLPFEAVLIKPKLSSGQLPPLLAFPHGGPHAVNTTDFSSAVAFHVASGISVLFINYRGSTGFGQAALSSLPGKCGDQDVKDCMAAILAVAARDGQDKVCEKNKIAVQGGSHGGFLTCHLIGQYPEFFTSAAVRNPVCNIAHMSAISDIPDWCYFEAGLEYSLDKIPTAEDYQIMFRASPIAHAAKVKTPLLMLLGGSDKRVPYAQANDYCKLLRAKGVTTRVLYYSDGQHSLMNSLTMESDVWISMVLWALGRFKQPDFNVLE